MVNFSAVLVGINKYKGCPLNGCVNDVTIMRDILVKKYGVPASQIRLILDERATKDAILERLEWLIANDCENKMFYYSGHGAQVPVQDYSDANYEPDHMDELICPVNFDWNGTYITDNQIHALVAKLKGTQHISMVFDSCHSGTIDRSITNSTTRIKCIQTPLDLMSRSSKVSLANDLYKDTTEGVDLNANFFELYDKEVKPLEMAKVAYSAYNISIMTGCKDDQTSADYRFGNRYQGALSFVLQGILLANPNIDLKTLRDLCEAKLKQYHFEQTPQLICSEANLTKSFIQI